MLKITKHAVEKIKEDARKAYPEECCGLLVGKDGVVLEAVRVKNINTERAHDRYEIDPREFLMVEKESAKRGLSVLGIYHSHPDHPAEPSEFDRTRAWPEYLYLIVGVRKGNELTLRCWMLDENTERFREEKIMEE